MGTQPIVHMLIAFSHTNLIVRHAITQFTHANAVIVCTGCSGNLAHTQHVGLFKAWPTHQIPLPQQLKLGSYLCYTKSHGILGERICALWVSPGTETFLSHLMSTCFKFSFFFLQLMDCRLPLLCSNSPFCFSALKKSTLIRKYKFPHYDLFSSRTWNENDYELL